MVKIKFDPTRTLKSDNCRLIRYTFGLVNKEYPIVIGIDPGVDFGITLLHGNYAGIYHGSLARETQPGRYALRAFNLLKELTLYNNYIVCIIEGAAYNKAFGQVGLSEIRTGFYLSAVLRGFETHIIPPATIRKKVFGDHKKQAGDVWVQLNHNAADSLSMAMYGDMI